MRLFLFLSLCQNFLALAFLAEEIDEENFQAYTHTEAELMSALFKNYSPHVRPLKNPSRAMRIWIHPAVYSLIQVNTQQETIHFIFWFRMYWVDEFLQWNPSSYGNITKLTIPAGQIWRPDFVVFNAVHSEFGTTPFHRSLVKLDHDGGVSAVMLDIVNARCSFKIKNFPFESEQCTLEISSWGYEINQVELAPLSETQSESHTVYNEHPEWEIQEIWTDLTISEYLWNMEGLNLPKRYFHEIQFTIKFKPKPFYYIFVMILPSFIVTTIALLGLFSPFNSNGEREEKVTLGLTTLLTMTVMLQLVESAVPKSSDGLALLGKYVFFELTISSVGTVVAVVIMYLHQRALTLYWKPPDWLTKFTLRKKVKKKRNFYDFIHPEKAPLAVSEFGEDNVKLANKDLEKLRNSIVPCLTVLQSLELRLNSYKEEKQKSKTWTLIFDAFDLCLMSIFIIVNCSVTFYIFFL